MSEDTGGIKRTSLIDEELGYDPMNYGGSGLQAIPNPDGTNNVLLVMDPNQIDPALVQYLQPAPDGSGRMVMPSNVYFNQANALGTYGQLGSTDFMTSFGPLAAMGVMGGAASGLFGDLSVLGPEGMTGGSLLNTADTALIDAAGMGPGGNLGIAGEAGGNMGFFDDVIDWGSVDAGESVLPWTTDPSIENLGGGDFWGDTSWYDDLSQVDLGNEVNPWTTNPSLDDLGGTHSPGTPNLPGTPGLSSILRGLLGTNPDGTPRSLSSLFSGGNLLGQGLALAPSLAAINYARNQSPFDTSKLESAYSQIDPNSLTRQYDVDTGLGRENLTSSLTSRGVMGSSFGDQSLTNYNTSRDIGRSNVLSTGALGQANIASQIINAQAKEREIRNSLYGRALLALSGGLNPRSPI